MNRNIINNEKKNEKNNEKNIIQEDLIRIISTDLPWENLDLIESLRKEIFFIDNISKNEIIEEHSTF